MLEKPESILLNPPGIELGRRNAIVWRQAKDYHFEDFPGSVSIKSVVKGCAVWETQGGRFEVDRNSYIVLNTGQNYSMTIESLSPVETFCVFFEPGFVEDAYRTRKTPNSQLLDDPFCGDISIGFHERIHEHNDRLRVLVTRMHTTVMNQRVRQDELEEQFIQLANHLVGLRGEVSQEIERLSATRHVTRMELYRRLQDGKRLIDTSLDCRLSLSEIASSVHLSKFHFHRLFTETFRETPHQYHVRRRLERAASFLVSTDIPITTICLNTGFGSLGSFSSLFGKHFGVSPREFRRQYKN
ncbi:hypothetical protein BZZ01_28595 [Nostocales cyanobacterium HT-58-2]|nr:hypothetical protein BZZ01_28595 [Nostocales cyanobacterium HT-58-2]